MQPVRLRRPPHQDHVSTAQRQLQRLRHRLVCRKRFVLHEEITLCTEREGCDTGIFTEEAFVVAVIGDAVRACGVVVDQAEIECAAGGLLRDSAEGVEARGEWAWSATVSGLRNCLACVFGVDNLVAVEIKA